MAFTGCPPNSRRYVSLTRAVACSGLALVGVVGARDEIDRARAAFAQPPDHAVGTEPGSGFGRCRYSCPLSGGLIKEAVLLGAFDRRQELPSFQFHRRVARRLLADVGSPLLDGQRRRAVKERTDAPKSFRPAFLDLYLP